MAYARFAADSNVYVFESDRGVECCWCALNGSDTVVAESHQAMVEHLHNHKAAGHKVPAQAIAELLADVREV